MRITSWIWRRGRARRALPGVLVVFAITACSFKRPDPLVDDAAVDDSGVADSADGGDTTAGCNRDGDCSGTTPFCVERTCSVCRDSTTCPAARPACDITTHDCRNCVKDSECDSGACDLAAGSCVAPSAIFYASPTGTTSDPCARLLPCSLDKAVTVIDAAHPYLVMLPGIYVVFDLNISAQKVTICGNDTTIDATLGGFNISGGSTVAMRDLKIVSHSTSIVSLLRTTPILGFRYTIQYLDSELTLDNILLDLSDPGPGGPHAIQGRHAISIRNTTVRRGQLELDGDVSIDQSNFLDTSVRIIQSTEEFVSVTNSVFAASDAAAVLMVVDPGDSTGIGGAVVFNNTFAFGSTSCGGGAVVHKPKFFESNIFFHTPGSVAEGCLYRYNLSFPAQDLGGDHNVTGDALFVNAADGDFHLKAASPAIDAANPTPAALSTHDHDGRPRPPGGGVDIGAFEYVP